MHFYRANDISLLIKCVISYNGILPRLFFTWFFKKLCKRCRKTAGIALTVVTNIEIAGTNANATYKPLLNSQIIQSLLVRFDLLFHNGCHDDVILEADVSHNMWSIKLSTFSPFKLVFIHCIIISFNFIQLLNLKLKVLKSRITIFFKF